MGHDTIQTRSSYFRSQSNHFFFILIRSFHSKEMDISNKNSHNKSNKFFFLLNKIPSSSFFAVEWPVLIFICDLSQRNNAEACRSHNRIDTRVNVFMAKV